MKQRYVINMQNVDNLDDIKIEISPLTIFTGDNNSGKTVVMNIIYGIFRLSMKIIQKGDKFSKEYKACKDFIKELKNSGELCIDRNIGNMFCDFFNVSLLQNKEYFFNEIFNVSIYNNYKRFEDANIFLSDYRIFPNVYLAIDDFCDEIVIEGDYVKIPRAYFDNEDCLIELICKKIIDDGFSDVSFYKPIFMPSGRSNFLCYSELFKNLKYQNLSISDFIKNIEGLKFSDNSIYSNIYNFIENKIVNGTFTKDSFRSYLNNIEIPISMASDLIREIAPLVLFLKSSERFTSFFIEEIEVHMNLNLQRCISSALVRIVNSGIAVFMSTNSSVILDQIKNFVLLNNLNRSKIEGFGYVINDVLNFNDINIYEFRCKECKTHVNKLNITYNGFKVSSNERILEDILKENHQLRFEMFENN